MVKKYDFTHKTKKYIAKDNNLIDASTISKYITEYHSIFYDLSLLDEIKFNSENEKQALIKDIICNTSVSWYDQPLPTLCKVDDYTLISGQINTVYHKVFSKRTWKRIMVIVEVVKAELSVDKRSDFYDKYFSVHVSDYRAENHHSQSACEIML